MPRRESENLRVPVHVDERLPVADLSGEDYAVFQLRVFSVQFGILAAICAKASSRISVAFWRVPSLPTVRIVLLRSENGLKG